MIDFVVADREEAERGLPIRTPYIVISISDPTRPRPKLRPSALCREVLSLRFHDSEPVAGFPLPSEITLMTEQDAQAVWELVCRWREEISTILVHCEAGMSRSPAVAAAVCRGLGQDDSGFFQDFQPN